MAKRVVASRIRALYQGQSRFTDDLEEGIEDTL